jgi:isocitrate lyase
MNSMAPRRGRFDGIHRTYGPADVEKLKGSVRIAHSLAEHGAARLWQALHAKPFLRALGASTGNQAMQMAKAGLEAIYVSGWQVAADANNAGEMYPDQSLYPSSSVPDVVRRINRTLQRADQIGQLEGQDPLTGFCPSSPTPKPASVDP